MLIAALIPTAALPFAAVAYLAESARTGVRSMDRIAIRYRAAFWTLFYFGPKAAWDLSFIRAVMAIIRNESLGDPKNYLGDDTLTVGPSVGPMQVYRGTALRYGLWHSSQGGHEEYARLAQDEGKTLRWGVKVFREKVRENSGDLKEAIRAYNGTGSAAEAYAQKAADFLSQKWGVAV